MTLPTTTQLNSPDDDSDMFGPPRSSPPIGYHHQRSRVPMISPKLRQREERKRILQLCAHKLERIKDSETNLRRSVCINNTFSRLTDEVRREKQSRYLANLPKSSSDNKPETARDNMYNPYSTPSHCINYSNPMELRCDHYQNIHQHHTWTGKPTAYTPACCSNNNNNNTSLATSTSSATTNLGALSSCRLSSTIIPQINDRNHCTATTSVTSSLTTLTSSSSSLLSSSSCISNSNLTITNSVDNDLELLDRELNAINASMPLIDPEIQHGAEQLEKAISSRKRSSSSSLSLHSSSTSRTEEENDRLVREALSQFYLPTQRLISAIDDCPLDIKRSKLTTNNDLDLDLNLDLNQNQKEFEVIMDALRLSTSSPTPSASDSCGQAAMSESGVFHNLVVTSLET